MTYSQATLYAYTGNIIMLPGWKGYFYWNYATKEFNFRNGDYHLNKKQLKDKGIMDRTDFYYII